MPPDFLIIGAMKSGTSTVTAFLEDHPETYVPPYFEPEFFALDEVWAQGAAWYEAHFDPGADFKLRGENSNVYSNATIAPQTAERIASLYPDIKLIYILREPISRTRSAWYELRSHSGVTAPPDAGPRGARATGNLRGSEPVLEEPFRLSRGLR